MDIVQSVMSLETIDELTSFLESRVAADARSELLAKLDTLIDYADAHEWATAVRMCESLAIVGWGDREQIDAISHFNGDCWETQFVTDRNEYRFRFARWSRRKAGWTLRNPEFHPSPDFPDRPAVDWKQHAGKEFPVVARESLPSQRNYRRQMPIVMGLYSGSNETSRTVSLLRTELRERLLATMAPDSYGDAIEKFYFTLYCPALSGDFEPELKVGVFNAKRKAFYSDLYFNREFGNLSAAKQHAFIRQHLLAAIDGLATKLKKRKVSYDIASFRSHVESALKNWSDKSS